jgi:flagellar export protein FliJ
MPVSRSFKLQPVLNLKERRQEQLQVVLAAQQAEEERQRQTLVALEEERGRRMHELGGFCGGGTLDLTVIDAAMLYLDVVDDAVITQTDVAAQATAATEAAREALTTAMQERKALEKLAERQKENLRQHLRQLESNQADETAISRYHRRTAGA